MSALIKRQLFLLFSPPIPSTFIVFTGFLIETVNSFDGNNQKREKTQTYTLT